MAYSIRILARANRDIEQAHNFLYERAPQAAANWYRLLKIEIASLCEMPARCPIAPEAATLGFELRHLVHGKHPGIYRIVFRIVEDKQEVHVLTVRHGARKPLTEEDIQPFLEIPRG